MSAYASELSLGKRLMLELVDPASGTVKTSSLAALDKLLLGLGFQKNSAVEYGPAGGQQLFYQNGRVVVRLKTKGDQAGFRANQPHLSVSLVDGAGLNWFNELAKFNAEGQLAAKSMTTPDRFKPTDHDNNPQRFVVIMGGNYDGPGADAWAQRTHFTFAGNMLTA